MKTVTVFLDVGAHLGQTLEAVRRQDFDRIHCFEPVSRCWPALTRLATKRTIIEKFGLWNQNTAVSIYDPGTMGSGMWLKNRRRTDTLVTRELCNFRRASDWFLEHISYNEKVYLKLNCEGCECDILDDLISSGEFAKVSFLMVDFDARKITELRDKLVATRDRLKMYTAPRVLTSREAMIGTTHKARIHNWLRMVGWNTQKDIR